MAKQKGIFINDIWLVDFPYITKGNMHKIRPALVLGYNEDIIKVQKITTKYKLGYKKINCLKKPSYLADDIIELEDYKFYKRIGRMKNE